ncbi:hypothetical protein, partial [Bacteroides bouchesdurhonensis]|uniref:hypothetical protein n=1 Tax=Bacteroides bouchesdurhonensis TaxID=1841855 RepID=UPI0022E253D2
LNGDLTLPKNDDLKFAYYTMNASVEPCPHGKRTCRVPHRQGQAHCRHRNDRAVGNSPYPYRGRRDFKVLYP